MCVDYGRRCEQRQVSRNSLPNIQARCITYIHIYIIIYIAVEKLATDELCKICMDAPIECVFLECGHMATCTNCGKVLNECPICRQYIVRVVRFFRA